MFFAKLCVFIKLIHMGPYWVRCGPILANMGSYHHGLSPGLHGPVKAEDKEKQACGGLQVVRLSFPPTCDIEAVSKVLAQSVTAAR